MINKNLQLENAVKGEISRIVSNPINASISSNDDGAKLLLGNLAENFQRIENNIQAQGMNKYKADYQNALTTVLNSENFTNLYTKDGKKDEAMKYLKKFNDSWKARTREYNIRGGYNLNELGIVRDTFMNNAVISVSTKALAYEKERSRDYGFETLAGFESAMKVAMNSGDETTLKYNEAMFKQTLEQLHKDELISSREKEAQLLAFKSTIATGRFEYQVNRATEAGDWATLEKLSVLGDNSQYMASLGGNGTERLGHLAKLPSKKSRKDELEAMLNNGIVRDYAINSQRFASSTDDSLGTEIRYESETAWKKFETNPVRTTIDVANMNIQNVTNKEQFAYDLVQAIVLNHAGSEKFSQMETGWDSYINYLNTTETDDGDKLMNKINFSDIFDNRVFKDFQDLPANERAPLIQNEILTNYNSVPDQIKLKLAEGYANKNGLSYLEYALGISNDNELVNVSKQTKEVFSNKEMVAIANDNFKKEAGKKASPNDWAKSGMLTTLDRWAWFSPAKFKQFRETASYINTLSPTSVERKAYAEAEDLANKVYIQTADIDKAREVYMKGVQAIIGDNKIIDVNGVPSMLPKKYSELEPAMSNILYAGLKTYKIIQVKDYGSSQTRKITLDELRKETLVPENLYYENIQDGIIQIKHKAKKELLNADGEPLTIDLNDVYLDYRPTLDITQGTGFYDDAVKFKSIEKSKGGI